MRIKGLKKLFLILILSIPALVFNPFWLNAQKEVAEKEKYGGTLTIAIPYDVKSLDSRYLPGSGSEGFGHAHIYDRLVDYSEKGAREVIPRLAESWRKVDDKTWLVYIRKGVKFHNGKELTAEDVWKNIDWKLNLKKYRDEKGWRPPRVRAYVRPIKKIEIVDKYTLKFNLEHPYAAFINAGLNWASQGIIDPEIVEKHDKRATLYPVGTGPFKFVEWVSGDHITLEKNEDYWEGKAYLDRVVFRVIPDSQTRLIALQKGEVDVAIELPLTALPLLKKDPKLGYFIVDDNTRRRGVLWFNLRRWPMNELKFRQAVAMGADWVNITKAAFPKGSAIFCRSFLKGSWAENPEAEKLLPPYNPKKARELIREVERKTGKPLPKEIDATVEKEEIKSNVFLMAAEQLKKIGVNLKIRILEHNVMLDTYRRDPKVSWEIMLQNVKGPGIDPSTWAKEFHSKTPNSGDLRDISAYGNPKLDELIERGDTTSDQKERKKLYQQMEKILLKDLPAIPIFNLPRLFGYNQRVHDLRAHDSMFLYLKTPWNNVWIEKKK